MTLTGTAMVLASAISTVAGNLLMRAGILRAGGFGPSARQIVSVFSQPSFLCGGVLYATAAMIWFRVLSTEDLSTSYPMLVSISFTLVTLGAVLFFGERMSTQKIVGLAVILAGILLTART